MKTLTSKSLLASVLGIALLTGCGGGSNSSDPVTVTPPVPPVVVVPAAPTVRNVAAPQAVGYLNEVQASSTNDTSDAGDLALINLEIDDTLEPGAV